MKRLAVIILTILTSVPQLISCTSAIIVGSASASGRPLMWKHRDTGHELNFIEKVMPKDGKMGYIALFNAGDTLLSEAWIGINEAGFAIMNTASYNLAPDTAVIKDKEGLIMSEALARCRNIDDFELLLRDIPKPMGVQANFGVIDANGHGAYFETDDYTYVKYDAADTPDGVLIRTNFSCSGKCGNGLGVVRYISACNLLQPYIDSCRVEPHVFIECLSRSFYRPDFNLDVLDSDLQTIEDVDFIPRRSTSASIVIEGVSTDNNTVLTDWTMWIVPGYPPCSRAYKTTYGSVPELLRPDALGSSPEWRRVNGLKHSVISENNGHFYVNLNLIREFNKNILSVDNVVYGNH